ncbi:ATP-binding cassette domain-containing protein [Kytococcus sp. Marseille-QA3725]
MRPVGWRRLATQVTLAALVILGVGGVGQSVGAVVAGRPAEDPDTTLVGWLAVALVGGVLLDAVGRLLWVGEVDRAEGELIDRIDDDAREIGLLSREMLWNVLSTVVSIVPMWVVAGLTWWPCPRGGGLVSRAAPVPEPVRAEPLRHLETQDLEMVHDDGTVGVEGARLRVEAGELVLLVGAVGSGKSSLLRGLAGLEHTRGSIRWNGRPVADPESFLRPGDLAGRPAGLGRACRIDPAPWAGAQCNRPRTGVGREAVVDAAGWPAPVGVP